MTCPSILTKIIEERDIWHKLSKKETMQELDKQIFLNIDHDLCVVTMIKTNELLVYPIPSQYKHMNAWRLFIQILAPSLGMQIRCAGCTDLKQVHSNFDYASHFGIFSSSKSLQKTEKLQVRALRFFNAIMICCQEHANAL